MRLTKWALSAVLLLTDAASAKAITFRSGSLGITHEMDAVVRRNFPGSREAVVRRSAQYKSSPLDPQINATVSTLCTTAVANINSSNPAGFVGCYNIIAYDQKNAMFQADLRLYQKQTPSGDFTNVSRDQVVVMLNFPSGVIQFQTPASKRSTTDLRKRDGDSTMFSETTMIGGVKSAYDVSKLNNTLLLSLMVPQISLRAPGSNAVVNMSATDTAWFVAGAFTNSSSQAAQIADPATAQAAAIAAAVFVLPGTTFGIFPIGFIITSVWTVLFLLAFGIGTLGRWKSRDVYRKRILTIGPRGRI